MNSTPSINNQETRLLDNILRFIRLLRKSGVKVGNRSSIDTLKSIKILKIGNRKEFYWALFSNLINRNEDKEIFDQCFYLFWQNPKIMEQMFNLLLPQIGNQKAPENKKEKTIKRINDLIQKPSIDKNEYLLIYHTTAKRHLYDYFIEIVPSHLLQSTRMDDFVYSRK